MPRHDQAPPGADHDSHDRLLMVRLASDDITRAERPAAEALRSACDECAALIDDVRRIARVTAILPAPRRPRDFRLSAEEARQARGSVLRRFMERLSAPGMGVLQPLGAAAVAIGFVMVVVGMGLPAMGGASPASNHAFDASPGAAASAQDQAAAEGAGRPSAGAPGAEADPDGFGGMQPVQERPSSRPGITRSGSEAPAAGGNSDGTDQPEPAASGPASGPPELAGGQAEPGASAEVRDAGVRAADEREERLARVQSGTPAGAGLVSLGLLLGLSGLLVLILRVVSLRTGRDPSIR